MNHHRFLLLLALALCLALTACGEEDSTSDRPEGRLPAIMAEESADGSNPYLPAGFTDGDQSWTQWESDDWSDWASDTTWEDDVWTQWESDTGNDWESYEDWGWWNALDPNWTQDDWEYLPDYELWMIWDEETECYYYYEETMGWFGCLDTWDDSMYILDYETGQWLPME